MHGQLSRLPVFIDKYPCALLRACIGEVAYLYPVFSRCVYDGVILGVAYPVVLDPYDVSITDDISTEGILIRIHKSDVGKLLFE